MSSTPHAARPATGRRSAGGCPPRALAFCGACAAAGAWASAAGATETTPSPIRTQNEHVPHRGHLALVTGMSISIGALGVGGLLLTDPGNLRRQHAGLYTAHTGLTLAPLIAHGVVGEWSRGALFSIAPALATAALASVLTAQPNAPNFSEEGAHLLYPVPITVAVVGSAVGVADAMLVDRRSPLTSIRPQYNRGYAGVSCGGLF